MEHLEIGKETVASQRALEEMEKQCSEMIPEPEFSEKCKMSKQRELHSATL